MEIRRGRKINSERKFFPGYVLVKMDMSDQAYHLVKNTPKVTGFLGSGLKPMPVSEREVARIIGAIEEGVEHVKPTISFEIGEKVKVIDGPFASFDGSVESVDEDRARLRVSVSIFGPRHSGGPGIRPGGEDHLRTLPRPLPVPGRGDSVGGQPGPHHGSTGRTSGQRGDHG